MGLRFLALGGIGEIGMNCLLVECDGKRILVDCGAKFPDETTRFADLVLPDLRFFDSISKTLKAIVITHAHEDHIGALPFVLSRCNVPVYASPFSFALARRRLQEHNVSGVDFRSLQPASTGAVGPFVYPPELPDIGLQLIRVTHSIPDAASLLLDTPYGRVLHTGDFKIDPEPMDGQHFDSAAFRAIGDQGLSLLLADSTNASVPGHTAPEASVVRELEIRIRDWPGRVLVTQFASNLHRLRGLEEVAKRTGRRLCLLGRSFKTYCEAARDAGLPTIDLGTTLDPDALAKAEPSTVLAVLTGSQGEARAALARAARGDHPQLNVGPQDLVLVSSRVIPGNEREVQRIVNDLRRRGASVVHPKAAAIHTSGHARQDELREMLALTRPSSFVPVHGEYAFLEDHAAMARAAGVADVMVVEDGEEFEYRCNGGLVRRALHTLEPHYYDGTVTGDATALGFEDRRRMFNSGAVFGVVERHLGSANSADVELTALGLFTNDGKHLDTAAQESVDAVRAMPKAANDREVEEAVESAVRRVFRRLTGKKPVVTIFVRGGTVST